MSGHGTTLPSAHGDAVLQATTRTTPEDFFVEEIAGFEPTGSGEHLLLTIEKRGMNTAFASRRIAEWAGVQDMAIGHAGLKDRHAVTRQRISVHLPGRSAPDVAALEDAELRVLDHQWHVKKLPRGALAGNRFVLVLRDVHGHRDAIEARLAAIQARGVPNYFGEQRFGHGGDNITKARVMFAGRRMRRDQRGMLLSAARSQLFNNVLAARVAGDCWDRGLEGEVWMLDGRRSVFGPEPFDDALAQRLAEFDIHPTGPLWGRGELRSQGEAAELETSALQSEEALALRVGLENAGLKQERRSLRLAVGSLGWDWLAEDSLKLAFRLPPGTYATSVLAELGAIRDVASRA